MNSPSICRRLRLPWKWACCSGFLVYVAASFVTGQEVFPPVADQAPREATPAAVTPVAKPTAPPEFLPRLSPIEEKILAALSDIESEVLKVTTQATADKAIITRTYPVSDLFSTREEAEELVESLVCGLGLVQKTKDGPAPLAVSVPSAAIIARLRGPQQDQLLQLLRDLREAKSLAPKRPVTGGDAPRLGGRANDDGRGSPRNADGKIIDEFSPGLQPDDFNSRPRLRELQPDPSSETPRKQPTPPVKPEVIKKI